MGKVISMNLYKYRRYVSDMPKQKALDLAELNKPQIDLRTDQAKVDGLKRLLKEIEEMGGVE